MWIDSHCHLDAAEFDADRDAVRQSAKALGVNLCVIPAVERKNFLTVQALAHRYGDVYALGIHPLYVPTALESDLAVLDQLLASSSSDNRLVALGEIGLDFFVPELCTPAMRSRQWSFYAEQLQLAKRHNLPVILHVRKSADLLLKGLRGAKLNKGGIAHAFNGSLQQAKAFLDLGFKLGFGGTITYERALQIRHLATTLPAEAIVLETDAPDIPPSWLYVAAQDRGRVGASKRNAPTELPRVGAYLASLRNMDRAELAHQTSQNVSQLLLLRFPLDQPAISNLAH